MRRLTSELSCYSLSAIAIALLLTAFQNCGSNSLFGLISSGSETKRGGDGQPLDGKSYVERGQCGIVPLAVKSKIILQTQSNTAILVKEDCVDLQTATAIDSSLWRLDSTNSDLMYYKQKTLTYEADPAPTPTPPQLLSQWTKIPSSTGAPSGRAFHSSVWTGSKLLVWGGENTGSGTPYVNDGAEYDPGTDSWTPITSTNAPSARGLQSTAWTGVKMLVWGGLDSISALGDGGIYDSKLRIWTSISSAGAPTARYGHTAVWTGSQMIVWGGSTSSISATNTGSAFNGSWVDLSSTGAPSARTGHIAVWTGSKMIVWGGADPAGPTYLNNGAIYDPYTDKWSALPTTGAPSGRANASVVMVGSKMIVMGGFNGSYLSDINTYDINNGLWETLTPSTSPEPRSGHSATWNGSSMVVFGGYAAPSVVAPTDLWLFK